MPIDLLVLDGADSANTNVTTAAGDPFVFESAADPSSMTDGSVNTQLALGNVLARTGAGGSGNGDLTFGGATPIVFDGGSSSNNLSFQAHRNINLNQATSYSNGSGTLTLAAGAFGGSGAITIAAALDTSASNAAVTFISQDPFTMTATGSVSSGSGAISVTADDIVVDAAATITNTGDVTLQPFNAAVTIGLGSAATFSISDAELDRINSTGLITIGSLANNQGIAIAADEAVTADSKNLRLLNAGNINVATNGLTGGDVTFQTNSAITNTGGGTVVADTLTLAAGLGIALNTNVATLTASNTTSGSVQITDLNGLDIAGVTLGAGSGNIEIATTNGSITTSGAITNSGIGSIALIAGGAGSTLTLSTPVTASGTVSLTADGDVSQTAGGVITAGRLTGSVTTGSALLNTASNLITNLGPFTANGGLLLTNAQSLHVSGAVGATTVALAANGATSDLTLGANVSSAGLAGSVTLTAGWAISQTGGAITTATLSGSAGTSATLDGANNINELSTFTTGNGAFTLNDAVGGLTVVGDVTATGGRVTIAVAADDGRLTVNAARNVRSDTSVTLTADQMLLAGNISNLAGGKVPLVVLRPTTAGQLISLGGGDAAGAPGTLGLTDAELDVINATTVTIGRSTAGNLTIDNNITLAPARVDNLLLVSGDNITGTGGIAVSGLALEAEQAILNNAANDVDTLAANITGAGQALTFAGDANGFSVGQIGAMVGIATNGGDVNLVTNGMLTVAAAINGAAIALGAASININAGIASFVGLTINTSGLATINGVVSGAGGLTLAGTGTALVTAAQTYFGVANINAGMLLATNGSALGSTAAGTTVASGATLALQGDVAVGDEALSITGQGGGAGALRNLGGNNTYGGTVTLAGAATIGSDADTLTLNNAAAVTGAGQNLTLAGAGNGAISGSIAIGTGTLTKAGTGAWTLSGTSTYTGETAVNAGTLSVNGSIAGDVTVNGGTLRGFGTVGAVTVQSGGHVAPGTSPGILTSGDFALNAGGVLDIEIGGTTPGAGHDQLRVTGTVELHGTLNAQLFGPFAPTHLNVFVIIDNDRTDAVVGNFVGLAEGAEFTLGGRALTVTYGYDASDGIGPGNDVALIANAGATNTVLPPQTVAEDLVLVFTGANAIAVSDPDGESLTVTLAVTDGRLLLATTSNITVVAGANGTSTVTFSGLAADVNAALDGLSYRGNLHANGPDTLTITTDDGNGLANSVDTDVVAIDVTPVNDPPVPGPDVLSAIGEDSGVRIIPFATLLANDNPGPADEAGQTLTITAVGNVVGGTATLVGTNVRFTPGADFNGTASFDYVAEDNGTTNGVANARAASGHVSFAVTPVPDPPFIQDFDGDATGDVLWRNADTGYVAEWEMRNGTVWIERGVGGFDDTWSIVDTADVTGDGVTDLLWRNNETGYVAEWEMRDGNVWIARGVGVLPTEWQFATSGDIDGDGTSDILWQRPSDGALVAWEMQDGHLAAAHGLPSLGPAWTRAESGDFNGDGTTDIVWQRPSDGALALWEMADGSVAVARGIRSLGPSWTLAESGDFNGDETSDILLRDADGSLTSFEMQNGAIAVERGLGGFDPTWTLADVNDVTGDGTSDILWRHDATGVVILWEMQGGVVAAERDVGRAFGTDWSLV